MYRLGIDLGGTNIVAAIVDDHYKIVSKTNRKTNRKRSVEEIVSDIAETASDAIKDAGLQTGDILSAGIGVPGSVDPRRGVLCSANNLGVSGMFDIPIAQMLGEYLPFDFYVENDANAAAYGELLAGAGQGARNFIMITLGTGIGGGIILNRQLYSGSNYAGGEVGHTVIYADGKMCNCGRRGCWEAYASVTALIEQTQDAMRNHPDSVLWELCDGDIERVDGMTAFAAMRKKDQTGTLVVDQYIRYISIGIVNMINIFQPDVLCIGGGISKEGDALLLPIKEYVKKEDYDGNFAVEIKMASLGNDAGLIGAAFLDW